MTNDERQQRIEPGLVTAKHCAARYSTADLRCDPAVNRALVRFHERMVVGFRGDPDGALMVNSMYRPAGETCMTDYGGRIDLTDANGHWTGRSIDFSAAKTAARYFPADPAPWRRDDVRDALYTAGFRFPWYWKNGRVHEHWHVGVEVTGWTQSLAYRGRPAHWRPRPRHDEHYRNGEAD